MTVISEYHYDRAGVGHTHSYLMPVVQRILSSIEVAPKIFELGCGNGSTAAYLAANGYNIVGVDPSESGIAVARQHYPTCLFEVASTDDDVAGRFGAFDVVLSLEVIEHVYSPKRYVEVVNQLLVAGGRAIISTPYHGYIKNLALALSGKMDAHFTALWEGGHIKFWSIPTIRKLFEDHGFELISAHRVGRVPQLAKSMILEFRKLPAQALNNAAS